MPLQAADPANWWPHLLSIALIVAKIPAVEGGMLISNVNDLSNCRSVFKPIIPNLSPGSQRIASEEA